MGQISTLSRQNYADIQDRIAEEMAECASLEQAAQRYMSILYESLQESIVLARLFATIPFGQLPDTNKTFVQNLASSAGIESLIKNETLVLSLLGTRGEKPEWNERSNSQGHIGIPLASSDFIDKIPMMSRLLKQLGAGIDWIDSEDTRLVAKTFESLSGVFHVEDASTEVDNEGRKIIAAQDFVEACNVKTVFGLGGCYLGTLFFFTTIVFLRETLAKSDAEKFIIQANKFKTSTLNLVNEGRIFAEV